MSSYSSLALNESACSFQKKAEKELNKFRLFGKPDFTEVGENYQRAANCYRSEKKYESAIDCYRLAATQFLKEDSKHDAVQQYAKMIEIMTHFLEKLETYELMLDIYYDQGNFDHASRTLLKMGDLCFENFDYEKAMKYYRELISQEPKHHTHIHALASMVKIHYALSEFEKMGTFCELLFCSHNILSYFVKVALCHLECENYLKVSQLLDLQKISFLEKEFIEKLTTVCRNSDIDDFNVLINKYKDYSLMDDIAVSLLLRIKKRMVDAEDSLL